jgi:hypothetical protein
MLAVIFLWKNVLTNSIVKSKVIRDMYPLFEEYTL